MLEINLAPLDIKKKRRKKGRSLKGFAIPLEIVVGVGGGLLMLLMVVHIVFLAINLTQVGQLKVLKSHFVKIASQKKQVDETLAELRGLQGRKQSIYRIIGDERIFWSKKLNLIGDLLPAGVWLNRISVNVNVLSIAGYAVARQEQGMSNVHSFVSAIKNNTDFMEKVIDLELPKIQVVKYQGADAAEFLLEVKILVKEKEINALAEVTPTKKDKKKSSVKKFPAKKKK